MMLLPDSQARADAVNPEHSCVVQAPAGAGKTTLLANRFLALLEFVAAPEEILAITFTIKAAAEMRQRVLELLQSDSALAIRVRSRAAELDWQLESNPNRLKIQTIDSFTLQISQNGSGPENLTGYRIVEDATLYYQQAAVGLLSQLIDGQDIGPLVADFLASTDNDAESMIRLVCTMLAKRDQWLGVAHAVSAEDGSIDELLKDTTESLRADVVGEIESRLDEMDRTWLSAISISSGDSSGHWAQGVSALFTKDGKLRKKVDTKTITELAQRREAHKWLQSLHDREMAGLFERLHAFPQVDELSRHAGFLRVCCINLAVAAVELDKIFREEGLTDFTGLLLTAKKMLRDNEGSPTDLALLLDYKIQHILVDEFQDTSRAQQQLFQLLVEAWQQDHQSTFFAVGDPMQSIYRFRDADVEIFSEVKSDGIAQLPLRNCELVANFRSDAILVDWVNNVFAPLINAPSFQAQRVTYTHAVAINTSSEDARVDCQSFADPIMEVNACVDRVVELLAASDDSTIAILCRARGHLPQLLKQLHFQNISWQATDIDPLANTAVVMDLLSMLEVLVHPDIRQPWIALLRSPMCGIELAEMLDFTGENFLQKIEHAEYASIRRLHGAFVWARTRLYDVTMREVLEGFWLRSGGLDAYFSDEIENALDFFRFLDEQALAWPDLNALQLAVQRLFARPTVGARQVPAIPRSAERVQILTVHKAKGLEFDHVIVPNLDKTTGSDDPSLLLWRPTSQGLMIGARGDPIHKWLQGLNRELARMEEQRLLYVACTRAKTSLMLTFVKEEDKKARGLARYIDDYATPNTQVPNAQEDDKQTNATGDLQENLELNLEQNLEVDQLSVRTLSRLPNKYEWHPPAMTDLPKSTLPTKIEDEIADRIEVEIGTWVHRVLAFLGRRAQTALSKDELTVWLEAQNVSPAIQSAVARQINRVLGSEVGQWVLSPHAQHESESAYQLAVDGQVQTIVIDRMFVCEGMRWIIDYKSSQNVSSAPEILHDRYRPQLAKYAHAMQLIYPERICTALLFTDLARLDTIEL
jgi:ATP-dependent helicase/nuclease subunit A